MSLVLTETWYFLTVGAKFVHIIHINYQLKKINPTNWCKLIFVTIV
jgi:hypothetical protein